MGVVWEASRRNLGDERERKRNSQSFFSVSLSTFFDFFFFFFLSTKKKNFKRHPRHHERRRRLDRLHRRHEVVDRRRQGRDRAFSQVCQARELVSLFVSVFLIFPKQNKKTSAAKKNTALTVFSLSTPIIVDQVRQRGRLRHARRRPRQDSPGGDGEGLGK